MADDVNTSFGARAVQFAAQLRPAEARSQQPTARHAGRRAFPT
jgi:hypothetical protein